MLLTVITTKSRRIAVKGDYKDVCMAIEQAMIEIEDGASQRALNYIDFSEYPNAFRYLEGKATVKELTKILPARIFIDTITDISMMAI